MPSRTGKDIEVLSGKSSILSAIKYIIHAEQQNTDSCIYIRMQPDQMAFDIIRTLCECKSTGSGHNIRVQHIIALDEKKILTDSDLYNLNTLNTLIPALATIPNYELLYYYTNIFTGNSAFSFLPYALISKDLVLQISANLEFGTLQRQPETVAFFKEIYLDIRAASIPLTVEIRDIRDLIYCGLQHKKGNGHFSFRLGFLMNIVLTESLLEKYINKSISNRNFIIKYASEILKTDIQAFKNSRSTTIISESEIRFFMESGILPSSNGLLEPFEYEDRVTLLRNYINLILDNPLSTLLFLKDSALNSDSYNKIYIDDSGANILLGNNFHFRRILNIRDPGILSLLIDFFENIPENICFQPSESINKAQMVLRNYS